MVWPEAQDLHFNPFTPLHGSDVNDQQISPWKIMSRWCISCIWCGNDCCPQWWWGELELAPWYTQRGTPLEAHTAEEADCSFICLGTQQLQFRLLKGWKMRFPKDSVWQTVAMLCLWALEVCQKHLPSTNCRAPELLSIICSAAQKLEHSDEWFAFFPAAPGREENPFI